MSSSYITIRRCYITGVALGISTLVIDASRLIARWRLSRKVGIGMWSQHLDDLACLIALPPAMGIAIAMIVGASRGVIGGHNSPAHMHNWIDSTTPTLVLLEKLVYIIFVLQPLALGFTKLAFLFFYRRLFVFPGFQMTSLVFIILTAAWIFIFLFGFIFDCGLDFDANWQSLETISRSCPFGFEATIAFTITDACLDLCILLLPLHWIFRLRLPHTQKLQLCGVFSLGGFAVAASIVRMVICIKQNTPSNASNDQYVSGSPTWDIIGITSLGLYWTVVGTDITLIACCLPILRPFLKISALSTVFSTVGSFFQRLSAHMGYKGYTQDAIDDANISHKSNKVRQLSVATIGSSSKRARIGCHKDAHTSDISLVELGKLIDVTLDVPSPHAPRDALALDLEEQWAKH